ncbi:MAG: hypothetical protein H0U76_30505 [Ktedonobacteraceae bacterium]|nr:hypothetical protein [Ktedonobacteraceae bacterium]
MNLNTLISFRHEVYQSLRHMVRNPDPNHAHNDIYLHPVIRHVVDVQ